MENIIQFIGRRPAALPRVFATFRDQGQPAETPWIFVNHTTSSATDPQHQKEGVARPGPAILACSYDWVIFSNLRYTRLLRGKTSVFGVMS